MTDTANAPERAFEFNTQGKAPSQKTKRIPPGLYTVSWKDGGTSEVAIGMTSNGDNWMAPTNWLRPAMVHSLEGGVWGSFERLERINATHCDELVAAAYLDATQVLEDEIDLARIALPQAVPVLRADIREIKNRTPTKAKVALTARDERMKAEGAREAQAKIARLTEALTPSGDTKAAYMSEFEFIVFGMNDDGEECSHKITVPWTAIKEIMAAIKARAALQENVDE